MPINTTRQTMDAGRALKLLDTLCSSRAEQLSLAQARLLIQILDSVGSETSNWTSSDRQDTLQKLSESGTHRLQELLEWSNITTSTEGTLQSLSFQSGYAVVLSLFTSDALVGSTLRNRRNLFYSLIHNSYKVIEETIRKAMDSICTLAAAVNDNTLSSQALPFKDILATVTNLWTEYVQIFKKAPDEHPSLRQMPTQLNRWLEAWLNGLASDPNHGGTYDRQRAASSIRNDIQRLSTILNRGQAQVAVPDASTTTASTSDRDRVPTNEQQLVLLVNVCVPPGHLRPDGPRHDNDHAQIEDILIAPTHKELMSTASSYIPSTVHNAPHHLAEHSMDRLLDIQFRLLREELIYPIKAAVGCIFRDLALPATTPSTLRNIINDKGGRYKEITQSDTIFFSVYTNVELTGVSVERRSISVGLTFDIPPGKGRTKSDKEREAYWRTLTKRRLKTGALVALVWNKTEVHLGLITSNTDDLVESTKKSGTRPRITVAFFDNAIERCAYNGLRAMSSRKRPSTNNAISPHFFIEVSVLFDAYKPFLEALKVEPTSVPFSRYLVQHPEGGMTGMSVDPPAYTTRNGFQWNLSSMFDPPRNLALRVNDQGSYAVVAQCLKQGTGTRLDPSQADALLSCLTNEVALIQGPPGTGKSYTAVQLLRVLIANNVRPILMVAFTNHALDHLLESVLAADVTKRVIRLGGRSQSPVLQEYTLDKVERFHSDFLRRGTNAAYGEMKRAEEELNRILVGDNKPKDSEFLALETHLVTMYPAHYDRLIIPPAQALEQMNKQSSVGSPTLEQIYNFWLSGRDRNWDSRRSNRKVQALLSDSDVWRMKPEERKSLSQTWKKESSEDEERYNMATYENLSKNYLEAKRAWEELQAQQRLEALKNADIIGCTTNGAARLLDLLKGLGHKVVLVEEAGQVLEAHSLATLVPSVEHLIMIGDPQQLRPTINNYAFSTDNPRGGYLFKFDQSLMERLDAAGLPMAQLNIQRRMRPEVSTLIRGCLYPRLQDHENVTKYPSVRGMVKNVWFLHHTNKEGGDGEDSVSKCNLFEVEMIKSLVLFFIRQGVYNDPSSIVILCTYLGQLTKIREALASCKLSVVLDERDEKLLADEDVQDESTPSSKEVDVSKQIRIRTVDNFQGEEADIILLSTVRNPGQGHTKGIGFLKSSNRTNVALSRARHGMFILGNGDALENGSGTWSSVIQELRRSDSYGPAIPFACHRHPKDIKWISKPNDIDVLFPDGRCLLPCDTKLPCGHACLSKCHPDDGAHSNAQWSSASATSLFPRLLWTVGTSSTMCLVHKRETNVEFCVRLSSRSVSETASILSMCPVTKTYRRELATQSAQKKWTAARENVPLVA
ncbi:related to ECM32-DNA dependent ATPase/DNA helicase B [Serendipita indica DSM 11827]|uniref:Related to ECM32-DNA dependent ATPase/DNA helicase B n=1 Tax=Serendipita indica (strain DSM 11827) TaxID=1109443 RepID=G4TJG8_SERID|nr:related to ECM32-DNA dependent ATPase/DNA helicase B [Serendipita indica DSM 11827]